MSERIYKTIEAVIDQSSNSITAEIDIGRSAKLQGIHMPAAWTTADISFQVSSTHHRGAVALKATSTYTETLASDISSTSWTLFAGGLKDPTVLLGIA